MYQLQGLYEGYTKNLDAIDKDLINMPKMIGQKSNPVNKLL